MTSVVREPSGRPTNGLRPIQFETQTNRYAEGSAIIRAGNTHVLCTASVEESVPGWLVGKGRGWITAEYSMLPRATHTRGRREREKVSGRTHEIQRLIGRALRTVVDLSQLGERSIHLDCDVLQADGGTRTASVTGGCVALGIALDGLIQAGKIPASAWIDTVSAISIGIHNGGVLTDLDYNEDSTCEVDANFVMTGTEKFVEVQGTAERNPFTRAQLNQMTDSAEEACRELHRIQLETFHKLGIAGPNLR